MNGTVPDEAPQFHHQTRYGYFLRDIAMRAMRAFAIIRTKTYVGFIVFPCVFLYFRCVGLVAALLLKSRSSARLRSVEWFGFTLALTKSRARL